MSVLLAGVDEAGYGPLLGPLVVGCAAVRCGAGSDGLDALSRSLREGRAGQLRVGDSKKIYGQSGLKGLELAVLSWLGLAGHAVHDLRALLAALGCGEVPIDRYPWYAGQNPSLPRAVARDAVVEAQGGLRTLLDEADEAWVGFQLRPVLAGEFNQRVRGANKAWLEISLVSDLLRDTSMRCVPGEEARIACDRLSGRKYYGDLLRYTYGSLPRVELETGEASRYSLDWEGRRIGVSFEVGADGIHLLVGLASMACKYVRELFMEMLNRYWCERIPGLSPTAGYQEDGQRFLQDLKPHLTEEIREMLVRKR